MGHNLLMNGVYWGYKPFTNRLLTSWDIQVGAHFVGSGGLLVFPSTFRISRWEVVVMASDRQPTPPGPRTPPPPPPEIRV